MKTIIALVLFTLVISGCETSQPFGIPSYIDYRIVPDSMILSGPTASTVYFHVSPPAFVWVECYDEAQKTTYYFYPENSFGPSLHLAEPGYIVVHRIERIFRDTVLVAQWDVKTTRVPIHQKVH